MSSLGASLHELIRKMDRSERRYFKLFIKSIGKKASNMALLFDALARQQAYNESKLERKFRGQAFMKHFHVTKQRLYDLILKSLRNYYDNQNIELEILERLKNIEILTRKRLINLMKRELDHLEAIVIEHEKVLYQPIVYKLQLYVESIISHPDDGQFELRLNQFEESLNKLDQFYPYWATMTKHHYYNRHQLSDFSTELKALANNIEDVDSLRLQEMVYSSLGNYYMAQNAWQEAFGYWKHAIKVIEQKDYYKSYTATHNYILSVMNAIDTCTHIPLVEEFEVYCQKFDHINFQSVGSRAQQVQQYFYINLRLRFYRKVGMVKAGLEWIAKFGAILEQYPHLEKDVHATILANFESANIYLLAENYNQALDYLQASLNNLKDNKTKIEFQQMIRLIELLIYYHLESYILLPNLIRSFQRQLEKDTSYYELCILVVNLLKKLIKTPVLDEQAQFLKEYQEKVINLPNYLDFAIYFPFSEWMDALRIGVPLAQVLQKKYAINIPE